MLCGLQVKTEVLLEDTSCIYGDTGQTEQAEWLTNENEPWSTRQIWWKISVFSYKNESLHVVSVTY